MRRVTFFLAFLLVALGVGLYLGTGRESVTALIPAFLGVGLAICALVATTERRRMHAMHVAVLLAVAGVAGSARGVPAALRHMGGEAIERPAAAWGQTATALLCLGYVVLAIRSFVRARRARKARGD